ncbi:MAG: PD-(D/E)XK nuclease domain-containing protein [Roseovarius sp.]|nr:PD-(D/E)XK nuclease domain-containing protein [Roseovarius sp.]
MEFKMVEKAKDAEAALEAALAQMRDRGYAEKYINREKPVHLIAMVCGREDQKLLDVRAETTGNRD